MSRNFFSKKKRSIGLFLFLSLLIHLLLFFVVRDGMQYWASLQEPVEPQPVWVELKKLELPIVDMPKPEQEAVPEKPSAESLYNQKVAEETVRPTEAAPPREAPASPPPQPEVAQAPKKEPAKPAEAEPKPRENKTVEELYTKKEEEPKSSPSQRIPGMPGATSEAGSPADDFLPNYKVGNRTYLNTLANPNVAYYVELKRKFRLTWNPAPSLRAQSASIARGKIDVVLGVSVNARGELVDLKVIRSSGLEGYDREGKRTVQASAPFSSPPANLMGEDGLLHMAWTFVVYL